MIFTMPSLQPLSYVSLANSIPGLQAGNVDEALGSQITKENSSMQ